MTDSNRNNNQSNNEAELRCCLGFSLGCMPLTLTTMVVSVFVFLSALKAYYDDGNRMDRLDHNYNHGDCKHYIGYYGPDPDNCPNNPITCNEFCTGWFDAYHAADTALFFLCAMGFVFFSCIVILFCTNLGPHAIEDSRTFIKNIRTFISRCGETRVAPDKYSSVNNSDIEDLMFEGDGSETTTINSARRYQKYANAQSTFDENNDINQPQENQQTFFSSFK